ncbi:MAG: DoxX family membrane protein [Patescibacteria group bacterium]
MLNPFPIQFLALIAYFLLRVFLGIALLYLGVRHLKYRREIISHVSWLPTGSWIGIVLGVFEIGVAIFILLGYYTQYAVLLLGLHAIEMLLVRHWFTHHSLPPRLFYWLVLGICLSLFITGAGAPAIDLPI